MKAARVVLGVAVVVAFLGWAAIPLVAELVGSWR